MSQVHRKALDRSLVELCRDLHVDDILIHLISKDVLTDEDQERLEIGTRTEKVKKLVNILKRKRDETFDKFVESLEETQDFLAESLRSHKSDLEEQLAAGGDRSSIPDERINQPEALVTDQDLNKIAGEIGPEWKKVGLSLGLSKTQLFQCEADNPNAVHDKIFAMLHKWKRKEQHNATRSVLINKLAATDSVDPSAFEFMLKT